VSDPWQPDQRRRVVVFVAVLVLCVALAAGYALHASRRALPAAGAEGVAAAGPAEGFSGRQLLYRSTALGDSYGRVALVPLGAGGMPADAGRPRLTALQCERVHFAAGRGVCLEARRAALTVYAAHIVDSEFKVLHTLPLAGPPSRARVSPDGRLAALTVFVSGHAYGGADFTTRTSVIDTGSGRTLIEDLEALDVTRSGQPFKPADANFWGVTFSRDGQGFYVTLGTGGKTLLVQADLATRRARVVHDNVECPSLSPDGTRVAFKRKVAGAAGAAGGAGGRPGWQLVVLELASGKETMLVAEKRSVDDQVEWLDDRELAYALPADASQGSASTDLWVLGADGASAPRLLLPRAFSPAVLR
jgi:hypothetical protein